ncbi:hypothetical protein [Thermococcus sp. LS1]|uniref:hypothetical protein n=1 Tax=Thermococcus sp. LS1 TaxID=1638259 RepID=UPI00351B3A84
MARFSNNYASFLYHVNRYFLFATNEKPLFGNVGWDEVLPCDFDKNGHEKYKQLKEALGGGV